MWKGVIINGRMIEIATNNQNKQHNVHFWEEREGRKKQNT